MGGILSKFESSENLKSIRSSSNLNYLAQVNKMLPVKHEPLPSTPLTSSALMESPANIEFSLARRESLLGKYIVLSHIDDCVNVVSGPRANQIYKNVFTSVLNNSFHANIHSQIHG